MRSFFVSILEVFEIALIAIGAVFLIRTFLVQPFLVSGASMAPNFENGDYLLIDELSYRFRPPERGEVVVFHYPNDPSVFFIKRIVALPGEHIEIKNNQVTIFNKEHPSGFVLGEKYLPSGTVTSDKGEVALASDEYFALGDNRSFSFDSRSWGPLKSKFLVGLVRVRLWPLNEVYLFAAPQY